MFKDSVIWIPPSNRTDSSWLSTADCVWGGPQWLKSKQCLKLEIYSELEPLFKMSLRVPDASQVDVINDLLMLKSHSGDKNVGKSQSAAKTQRNIGTAGVPYEFTPLVGGSYGVIDIFQSITFMKAYKNSSFEVKLYCR